MDSDRNGLLYDRELCCCDFTPEELFIIKAVYDADEGFGVPTRIVARRVGRSESNTRRHLRRLYDRNIVFPIATEGNALIWELSLSPEQKDALWLDKTVSPDCCAGAEA